MDEMMYPELKQGERVAVNIGYHVLPGVVVESDDLEARVLLAGFGRRTFARFDVYSIPDESARLKEAVMVQTATMTQCVEKIVQDGAV